VAAVGRDGHRRRAGQSGRHLRREHHDVEVDGRWKNICGFKGAPGGDDYQRIWISTENPQIIALSSDQARSISVNGGVTWSSWYNQPTAQFYHVTTDNRFPYWFTAPSRKAAPSRTQSRSDYGEITFAIGV